MSHVDLYGMFGVFSSTSIFNLILVRSAKSPRYCVEEKWFKQLDPILSLSNLIFTEGYYFALVPTNFSHSCSPHRAAFSAL